MPKGEISWTRPDDNGEKLQVNARHFGRVWRFYTRHRRYEQWQEVEHPPLEDWRELLDAVERRAARRLLPPDEIQRVQKSIRERFPEAEL